MTDDKPKPKCKVETELNCKATAALDKDIEEDLEQEDGSLAELLGDDKTDA